MSKTKGLLILSLLVPAPVFAWDNKQPAPPLKLFGFDLMVFPTFLLVYVCLLMGFAAGWVAHVFRIKKKRQAEAESGQTPEEHEPHQAQEPH